MKLVSVEQMRALEKKADELGHSYDAMMQLAGTGLAEVIQNRYSAQKSSHTVIGLVGPGNNGGDTLVALMSLAEQGWKTKAICFFRNKNPDTLVDEYIKLGGEVFRYKDNLQDWLSNPAEIVLDGLLGTGTVLPLRPKMELLMKEIQKILQKQNQIVVAVDCPSGVDCTTGEVPDVVLSANLTVCMATVKQGMLKPAALIHAGEIVVIPIGLEHVISGWEDHLVNVVDEQMITETLPDRPSDGHKGTFGTVLVVGGTFNYTGAPLLAGSAAYAIGAGLVKIAIPEGLHSVIAGQLPEAIWLLLPQIQGSIARQGVDLVQKNLTNVDCLLIGPGLGMDDAVRKFVKDLLANQRSTQEHMGFIQSSDLRDGSESTPMPPLVIDADGLKNLVYIETWWKKLPGVCVLTPHPGEMSILTGLTIKDIQQNRCDIAVEFAKKWKHVVVLKGACTVVADPSGQAAIIPICTSALAHAGTGDVLAGMVAGLIAQGMDPYAGSVAAAWLHARAGQLAARQSGSTASVLARDVIQQIGPILGKFWKPD